MRRALSRNHLLVPFLVCVAAVSVCRPAVAQAQDQAALIRKLLTLTRAADLAVTAMEATVPVQRAANPRIPKEFWDEFVAGVRREMPRYIEMLVPVYDAHFTKPRRTA